MEVLALSQVAHSKNVLLVEYFRNFFFKMSFCAGYPKDLSFCFTRGRSVSSMHAIFLPDPLFGIVTMSMVLVCSWF